VGVSTTDWITPISEKSTEGQWPRQDQVVGEFQHNAPDDAPDTTSQTVKPTHPVSVERVIELHPQLMPRNDEDTGNPSSIGRNYMTIKQNTPATNYIIRGTIYTLQ
jgi:hypothetical protein